MIPKHALIFLANVVSFEKPAAPERIRHCFCFIAPLPPTPHPPLPPHPANLGNQVHTTPVKGERATFEKFQAFLRQKEPQCGGGASNLLRTKLIICLGEVPAPRSRPTPDLRLPRPSGSGTGGYITSERHFGCRSVPSPTTTGQHSTAFYEPAEVCRHQSDQFPEILQ